MNDEARVHAMIATACLGTTSDADLARSLRGFLEGAGVAPNDVDAIVGAPPRLALYRRLIRNNLTGVTEKMLARTRARLNEHAGAFDASFAEFLAERGPRTHYLRDVPREFLAWIEPRWRARADVPPWSIDLANHELSEFEMGAARASEDVPAVADVSLDRALVFTEPLRVMHHAFAVHELPDDEDDRTEPASRPTTLLVHRDHENVVRFLALTPFAAAIVVSLVAGTTLGDAVKGACDEVGTVTSDTVVAEVARLLADLGDRGILLGGRP